MIFSSAFMPSLEQIVSAAVVKEVDMRSECNLILRATRLMSLAIMAELEGKDQKTLSRSMRVLAAVFVFGEAMKAFSCVFIV